MRGNGSHSGLRSYLHAGRWGHCSLRARERPGTAGTGWGGQGRHWRLPGEARRGRPCSGPGQSAGVAKAVTPGLWRAAGEAEPGGFKQRDAECVEPEGPVGRPRRACHGERPCGSWPWEAADRSGAEKERPETREEGVTRRSLTPRALVVGAREGGGSGCGRLCPKVCLCKAQESEDRRPRSKA